MVAYALPTVPCVEPAASQWRAAAVVAAHTAQQPRRPRAHAQAQLAQSGRGSSKLHERQPAHKLPHAGEVAALLMCLVRPVPHRTAREGGGGHALPVARVGAASVVVLLHASYAASSRAAAATGHAAPTAPARAAPRLDRARTQPSRRRQRETRGDGQGRSSSPIARWHGPHAPTQAPRSQTVWALRPRVRPRACPSGHRCRHRGPTGAPSRGGSRPRRPDRRGAGCPGAGAGRVASAAGARGAVACRTAAGPQCSGCASSARPSASPW